jgi:xylulokinase
MRGDPCGPPDYFHEIAGVKHDTITRIGSGLASKARPSLGDDAMDSLMAIDLGSTSLKAAAFDPDGRCLASAGRPTEKVRPDPAHPDWVTWDPEQIWGGAADACRETVARLADPKSIRAVAVTGMGMDGVPVDRDGAVLYPFISWHDPRTKPQAAWWEKTVGADRTYAVTGFPIWHFEAVMRILWMREHEPGILARADRWLLIEDFLNHRLCGARVTDYSMASCFLLFDQRKRDWSDDLLAASGVPRSLLPDLKPSGTRIGTVTATAAARTGLPAGTPVVLGGQDHLCGTLPAGAHRPGMVQNVIGTWDNVMTAVAEPVLTPAARTAGVCVQAHVAPGVHAVWGGTPAGESLEWLRRVLGTGMDWDGAMASLAGARPGAHGAMYLPHFDAPGGGGPAAAFTGITAATTREDLLQAVLEGLAFQFAGLLQSLRDALAFRFDRITAGGGGARSPFGVQARADVTGLPVEVPEETDASLLGAAMLAGTGVGVYSNLDEAVLRVARGVRTVSPSPERTAAYASLLARFRALSRAPGAG